MGLWVFYLVRGESQTAYALGEQLLRAAQSVQAPALLLEAHYALGDTLFWLGELLPARAHLEQSLALYNPQQHRALASLYGEDAGVFSLAYMSFLLWWLGSPQQAVQKSQEALTLAQEVSHMYSLALAPFYAAGVHQLRREGQAAQARAEEVLALTQAHGFPFWQMWGTICWGWTVAEQGQAEEGLAHMQQGLAAYQAAGAQRGVTWQLGMLAEAYGRSGHPDEGLTVVAEALATVHTTGERAWEAELYRLKGELLLARSPEQHTEATACFQQALAIARRQQAKSLELRAAMSLGRLWQRQEKTEHARQLLTEVYTCNGEPSSDEERTR